MSLVLGGAGVGVGKTWGSLYEVCITVAGWIAFRKYRISNNPIP